MSLGGAGAFRFGFDGALPAAVVCELPESAVVMLTVSRTDTDLFNALRAGASGYLLKDIDPARLPLALRGVLDIASPEVLDLNRTHRRVCRDDRCAIHVLPFLIRRGSGKQPPLLLRGQRAADSFCCSSYLIPIGPVRVRMLPPCWKGCATP